MGEVANVAAVFPLRHAAIVVTAGVLLADAVRVADEERPHLLLDAKVDDLARGLVPEIAHAALGPTAHLVLRPLELLPTPGVLLAPALLLGKLAELSAALSLEATDAAPGDDERLACAGGDGGEVDLSKVDCGLHRAGCFTRLRYLNADVQLEAPVPHQRAGPGALGKRDGQDERWVAFAHRQHDAPFLVVDGLGGPLEGVERFGTPGILHAHLGMLLAQRTGRLHVGEEGVNDLLHRLGIEGEPAFGGLFQLTQSRPRCMCQTRFLMGLHAEVPDAGRFHLRFLEAAEAGGREIGQAIHANGLHTPLFFLSTRKPGRGRMGRRACAVAFTQSPLEGDGRSRSVL